MFGEKPVLMSPFQPHIPQGLAYDTTRAFVACESILASYQLTAMEFNFHVFIVANRGNR